MFAPLKTKGISFPVAQNFELTFSQKNFRFSLKQNPNFCGAYLRPSKQKSTEGTCGVQKTTDDTLINKHTPGVPGVSIPGCRSAFLVTRKLLTFFFGLVPCFLKCPNWAFLTCKVFRPRIMVRQRGR